MELIQWFSMGILFTLSVLGLAYLSLKVKLPWYGWGIMITGCLAILFGIGWAGASFFEGVAQSGSMGLMFFSIPGLLMIILAWRKFVPKGAML
ncbi:hypothetical protein L4D76_20565 [Photobacterium sagamiensis]|uniref:hypothetical protein n=1 Tax=Photobacterium sagamiensis TaxID=2910241 RepID=UPI003D0FCF01